MNPLIKKLIGALPDGLAGRLHALKHRVYWRTKGGDSHLLYFDAYKTRSEVLSVLCDWLATQAPLSRVRMLEFGCSGGNNLRLLREMLDVPVSCVGLDLQPDAIAFASRQFPEDTFLVGDDLALARLAPTLGHFDVFVASGVLSYIPQARCQAVLDCARELADVVLVCDDLSRFDAPAGGNDGVFQHPYAGMCRAAGLQVLVPPVASATGHRYSTFLAGPARG